MNEMLWATIRQLRFHERMSKRAIARHLGIHRDTVNLALESGQCPKSSPSLRGSMQSAEDSRLYYTRTQVLSRFLGQVAQSPHLNPLPPGERKFGLALWTCLPLPLRERAG
jgi:DNA-binding XRE family transcriptional regulator